ADAKKLQRVCRMDGGEIAARLGSFTFTSTGELSFGRDAAVVRSAEKTKVVQAKNGDFGVEVVTGDGSEQTLAFVNEVFFLKNNNGKWRLSRDPRGERNEYRSDALGVWRGFYDLIGHALVVEKRGGGRHAGRDVVKYGLSLPDQGAAAVAAGQQLAAAEP